MNDQKPQTESKKRKGYGPFVLLIVAALCVFVIIDMAVNSRKPGPLILNDADGTTRGINFITTNMRLLEQMYGNWLPNDIFWPTVLLDNMPNFQIGQLEVVRYNCRVLRDNLSRMRTTDKLDPHAEAAFTSLSNDPLKWWFPSAESKWKLGYKSLDSFKGGLVNGTSSFYPRADNLVELLNQYASLMGGVNTRLINAPGTTRETISMEEQKKGSSAVPDLVDVRAPWYKVDNNFYYAQGVAYALHASFMAIRVDFLDVLKDKNSVNLVDKILENLGRCNFEPLIIFNGDFDSIFANHSLNLSGVFNDARQKVNSLTIALMQG